MIYSLENIKKQLMQGRNPVKMQRVYGQNSINNYKLLESVSFKLSNDFIITIPEGYTWDLSSVPRFLWWLLPPDGDFQIAALIHDYLYEYNVALGVTRKFADKEMFIWSKAISGTHKFSLRNIDNKLRLLGVQWFGWYVFYK